jgi:hypothetical protein
MRWPSASLTACSCALLLAGCGGNGERAAPPPRPPKLPQALAQELATRSDLVARKLDANDSCGALAEATRLQREVIAAINAGRVAPRLQEPLQSAANGLVTRIGVCSPPAREEGEHDNGRHRGREKKHGKNGEGD